MVDTKKALKNRRGFIKAASAVTAATGIGFPFISRAEDKPIRIGMPTILSGRVAQLGISSRNAVMTEVEKFNAAGGLGGRKIEIITRDSKGKPDEAANNTRQLINGDGCEIIIDAELLGRRVCSAGSHPRIEGAVPAHQFRDVLALGRSEDSRSDGFSRRPPGHP